MAINADITVIVVSTNEAHWLDACLSTAYAHAGDARLDVVVVDNESADDTAALVGEHYAQARVVRCPNRGFPHANNRALMGALAPYVLFLNPDTEVVAGEFGDLIGVLERRPDVGLLGVRQLDGDGTLYPTIRRFPSGLRALGEAFTAERWRLRPAWLGERVLDPEAYEREQSCDWTTGAFMLARREALYGAGFMDERFFLYCDEPDLCLRIKRAGWEIVHSPAMTIVHHAGKAGVKPRLAAQEAYARRLYAFKHFARPHRWLYLGAIAVRHALRGALSRGPEAEQRRAAAGSAIAAVLGRAAPPFGAPPRTSIDPTTASGGAGGTTVGC